MALTMLGELVKQARIKRGLSQSALAKLANSTQSTISKLEKDGRVSVDSLERVLAALKMTVTLIPVERAGLSNES